MHQEEDPSGERIPPTAEIKEASIRNALKKCTWKDDNKLIIIHS